MTGQASVEILGVTPPEPRRRRRRIIIVTVVAVMVLSGIAAWPMVRQTPTVETSSTYAGIAGVRIYSDLSSEHTTDAVRYPQSPPVGGEHDPAWLACGAYDVPVRDENAVHDLEHGAVWIAYDPDLSASDVATLKAKLPANGIMAPYPGVAARIVLTVWGIQLGVDKISDPRIKAFLAKLGHGEAAPEMGVTCAGGTKDPTGGHAPDGIAV